MKQPLVLLSGIVASIIILSIIFPLNPMEPDLITKMKSNQHNVKPSVEAVRNYRIGDIVKIDDGGKALIWSQDENHIYYSKIVKDNNKNSVEEIWVSDLKGNKERINTQIKLNNVRKAKWSPDGTKLCFISNINNNKSGLLMYDIKDKIIKDITPKNISDIGVTSYDWDEESSYIIMSLDLIKPTIELYNVVTQKFSRIDIKVKSCSDVAFYKDGNIIFSDKDENFKYRIFSADRSGKNIKYIVDGQDFILSPGKDKLAILSDTDSQMELEVYNIATRERKMLYTWPVNDVYWLNNNSDLLFSTEEDCKSKYTYKGLIRYMEKNTDVIDISGAVYTIFVPSKYSNKIAMTSPDFVEGGLENKGIFIGELHK